MSKIKKELRPYFTVVPWFNHGTQKTLLVIPGSTRNLEEMLNQVQHDSVVS